MATAVDIICGICHARHTNTAADHWCQECDEGLCSECHQSYHGVSKATRNHGVVDIENYKKLPTSVLAITTHCLEHNAKYQNYCTNHEQLVCPVCISSDHKKCTDLLALPELIKTSKSSTLLESMEQSLQDLHTNIENIIQDRKHNLAELRKERRKIITEIKRVRDKINSYLDNLEQKITTDLQRAEEKMTQKIEKLLEQLTNKKKVVDQLEATTLALKKYASDMQTFFGSKEISKKIESEEKTVKSLFEDGSLEQLTLIYNIDDKISGILAKITTFGSVKIESSPASISLKVGKQAQIMSVIQQPSPKSIQDIKLTLLSTINIPYVYIYGRRIPTINIPSVCIHGSIICPDGKMLFANYSNNKVIVTNSNGTVDKEIPCSSSPNDIVMIDDKTIAVSTNNGIYIINITTKQTERFIKTSHWCYGITYNNDTLLWCEERKGIQKSNLTVNNITTILQQNQLPASCYLTTSGDKIYQTNPYSKSVTCFTTNGEKKWEFRDESFVSGPIGVTVDNDENVYITTNFSNTVIVLTPDGKQSRILLSQSDGMDLPWGIYFDKRNNTLLVANQHNKAFLYQIT